MTTVIASTGSNHFPTIANPQTIEGDAITGSPPSLAVGTPTPLAAAGCLGALTINGVNIGGSGGSAGAGLIDLTTWGNKDIVSFINGATNVVASVNRDGKIVLQTATGVAINIAGGATLLAALGLVAGNYVG
jgi:hypothetical protein